MIQANMMALRHALEMRDNRLYPNQEIAKNADLSRSTVSKLVRNKTSVLYFSTLAKLANYFQSKGLVIDVGDFFSWGDNGELVSNIGTLIQKLNPTPTEPEIAEATDIPLLRLENLIRGNVKRVYLDDLARLLVFFEERGVSLEVGDLLRV